MYLNKKGIENISYFLFIHLAVALIEGALEYREALAADLALEDLEEEEGGRDALGDLTDSSIINYESCLASPHSAAARSKLMNRTL